MAYEVVDPAQREERGMCFITYLDALRNSTQYDEVWQLADDERHTRVCMVWPDPEFTATEPHDKEDRMPRFIEERSRYAVTLTHDPREGTAVCWTARVYTPDQEDPVFSTFGGSREYTFDKAQAWIKASKQKPESPSTVFLDEDGEIIDRSEQAQ